MDDKQLRAIKARCDAATPGPWKFSKDSMGNYEYLEVFENKNGSDGEG